MVTSRIWFTAKQKAGLWERWKNGQSVLAISRAGVPPLLAARERADQGRTPLAVLSLLTADQGHAQGC